MPEQPPNINNRQDNIISFPKVRLSEVSSERETVEDIFSEKNFREFKRKLKIILNRVESSKNETLILNSLKNIFSKGLEKFKTEQYSAIESFANLRNAEYLEYLRFELGLIFENYKETFPTLEELEKEIVWKRILPEVLKDKPTKERIKKEIKLSLESNYQDYTKYLLKDAFLFDTFLFDKDAGIKDKNKKFLELMGIYEVRILFLEILNEYIQKDIIKFCEKVFGKIKEVFNLKNKFKTDLVKDLICEKVIFEIIVESDKIFNSLENNFSDTEFKKMLNLFYITYPFHIFKNDEGRQIYEIRKYLEDRKDTKQKFSEKLTNLIIKNKEKEDKKVYEMIEKICRICDICGYNFFEIINKSNKDILEIRKKLINFGHFKITTNSGDKLVSEILELDEIKSEGNNVIVLDSFRKK